MFLIQVDDITGINTLTSLETEIIKNLNKWDQKVATYSSFLAILQPINAFKFTKYKM